MAWYLSIIFVKPGTNTDQVARSRFPQMVDRNRILSNKFFSLPIASV